MAKAWTANLRLLVGLALVGMGCGSGAPAATRGDAASERTPDVGEPGDAASGTSDAPAGADGGAGLDLAADAALVDGGAERSSAEAGADALAAASSPWLTKDIGGPPVSGSLTTASTAFTLRGAGAGIGGTSDSFFFAYQKVTGDGELVARVKSLLKVSSSAQVGIMIRADDASPGAPHVFLSLLGDAAQGGQLRSRLTADGATDVVADPALKEGKVLRLVRAGKVVTAYRDDGAGGWTQVGVVEVALPDAVVMGLAVSDSGSTAPASAELDQARLSNLDADPATKGWVLRELGTMGASAVMSGGVLTVSGLGERTTPTSDVGVFVQQTFSSVHTITVKVAELVGGAPEARVGLMVRDGAPQSPDPGPAYAMMSVALGGGAAFQNRSRAGVMAQAGAGMAGVAAPVWLRLEKLDDIDASTSTFTGFLSTDGKSWNVLDSLTFPLKAPYSMGVYLLAGSASAFATSRLSELTVTTPK